MSFFNFFARKPTAPIARDRLQILLAHERASFGSNSDLIALLQEEILAVIRKHVTVERDKVQVKLDRGDSFSTLEIGVEIPPGAVEKQAEIRRAAARAS
ncbi:MAG: cell division topological specificity factor MinE [Proteobacteria bacterium]|nr:cell division topological specificity factor MinE [Pseudomonadota bacterium]